MAVGIRIKLAGITQEQFDHLFVPTPLGLGSDADESGESSPPERPTPARRASRTFASTETRRYASAFCLIASNSVWLIAPLSRSVFAFSISAAAPPLPAVSRT
jgi:hypothetical protein